MKIAAAQISCFLGDAKSNIAKMREFASRAREAGAELVVFPEMSDTGYSMPVIQQYAASWQEGAVPELQKMARSLGIGIVSGVSERAGSSLYNSQVFVAANGRIEARYRKTHLFAVAPIQEDKYFLAGEELVSFPLQGLRFGLSICYDLRFPQLYCKLAVDHQVNVFINSSAWPFPRLEHLRILAMARAIENQSYVILANRVGKDEGVPFCGTSAVIDPYGVVIAAASADREELVVADISHEVIQSVRARMPVFAHRRADL